MITNDNNTGTIFSPFELVKQFQDTFNVNPSRELREKLISEEAEELFKAAEGFLKEAADFLYVLTGSVVDGYEGELPEDVSIRADKALAMISIVPEDILMEAFWRVHQSNMSKLGEDGKPLLREDGKILKGPNYQEPDLSDLI